jgi:hypothetical protein
VRFVEMQAKVGRKVAAKGVIGVGFRASKSVMEMCRVQHQAHLAATLGKDAQEGYGIRASGKTNGNT